jgi:hypothetical protein
VDEQLYDEATRRRIDGGSLASDPARPASSSPGSSAQVRKRARFAATSALMGAIALGLQEVFDPPKDDEIVMEMDSSDPDRDDQPVTFVYDPMSVQRSRANVRPWLLTR